MMTRQIALALLTVLAFFIPALATAEPQRILFVGDELLDVSDIAPQFAALAKAMGRDVQVEVVSKPKYTLEQHLADEGTQATLAKGWSYVVMEQTPALTPEDSARLEASARRLAQRAWASSSHPALLMTWPPLTSWRAFPEAITSARSAAEKADAVLVPAAEAWMRAMSNDKNAGLYSGGVRPSARGNELTLLTLWFSLYPAGPQEFNQDYVTRLCRALGIEQLRREAWVDFATRAIDEPLAFH